MDSITVLSSSFALKNEFKLKLGIRIRDKHTGSATLLPDLQTYDTK
jgi:hypothetical protein